MRNSIYNEMTKKIMKNESVQLLLQESPEFSYLYKRLGMYGLGDNDLAVEFVVNFLIDNISQKHQELKMKKGMEKKLSSIKIIDV